MIDIIYDHYLAIDGSNINMTTARMTKKSNKITVIDVPSDIVELKVYLKNLRDTKILTIEETTTTQWLYTELKDYVNKVLICDPLRNRLLSEGPKTDKIDASKLVQLLKANLVKEVYHSTDRFLYLRRIVSVYEDLVKAGVRLKNQRFALLQACGKKDNKDSNLESQGDQFVLECLNRQIEVYAKEKKDYEIEFKQKKQRGPGYILDKSSFLTILSIFFLSFLSLLILSVTRLFTWDTPDSPIPKWVPISFSFSPVYL